jgi:RHS repeat-associated protein
MPTGAISYEYYPLGLCPGCAAGQLKTVRGPVGVDLTFTYDGHLQTSRTWTGLVNGSVAWTYDNDFDHLTETVTAPNGSASAAFGYDQDKLITCISPTTCSPAGADALRIVRDQSLGLPSSIIVGKVAENQTYDSFGSLLLKTASSSGAVVYSANYSANGVSRDDLGRVVSKSETLNNVTHTDTYTYDAQNRLTSVTADGSMSQWGYDANGNRISVSDASGQLTGSYDDQDRLTKYGEFTFQYTASGELKSRKSISTGASTSYTYDARGNLVSVVLPDGTLIEYLIDGQSRRVAKKENGTIVKQWLYRNALSPAAELDGAGNLVSEFVYGSNDRVPDYMLHGGTPYRVITDQLGSLRLVINAATGEVMQRMRHDSWGNVLEDSSPGFTPFGFAGGLYDSDTSLMRFGARDYDPVVGRWTSKDPVLFDGDQANLYAYAGSDPINAVDPDGRFLILVVVWGGEAYAAWEAYEAHQASNKAVGAAASKYGSDLHNTPGDAYKHCIASCLIAQQSGSSASAFFGWLNEQKGNLLQNQPPNEEQMDNVNNACGRSYGSGNGDGDCSAACADGLSRGVLQDAP